MTSRILLALFLSALLAPVARSAQFAADVHMVQHGNVLTGKFYARDSVYRIDMGAAESGIYVMVNQSTDSATIINTGTKQFMVVPVTNPQIIKTDPIQTARMLESLGAIKNYQGVDTLNGQPCDAYIYLRDNEPTLEIWMSRALTFPIRVGNPRDTATYMELVDITETSQPESLFTIPADFTERARPHRDAPEGAPAPRIIKEGTKLRVPLDPGRVAVFKLLNTANGPSDCRLTFFANGEQVPDSRTGGAERCEFHLAAQGDKDGHAFDCQADEVLIEVSKGVVAVDINQ